MDGRRDRVRRGPTDGGDRCGTGSRQHRQEPGHRDDGGGRRAGRSAGELPARALQRARGSARAPSTTSVRRSTTACRATRSGTHARSRGRTAHPRTPRARDGPPARSSASCTSEPPSSPRRNRPRPRSGPRTRSAPLPGRADSPPPPNRSWCCSIAWPHGPNHGSSGCRDASADRGVRLELLPFPRVGAARLVQDPGRHVDLADVVQQRGPPEPVAVWLREPQLARDEIREGPHPLAVSAGLPVVGRERGDEREDLLGGPGGLGIHARDRAPPGSAAPAGERCPRPAPSRSGTAPGRGTRARVGTGPRAAGSASRDAPRSRWRASRSRPGRGTRGSERCRSASARRGRTRTRWRPRPRRGRAPTWHATRS